MHRLTLHRDTRQYDPGGSPQSSHDGDPKVADGPPRSALQAALALTRRGIAVIPLRPRSKVPALPWTEYQHRRPSDSEVRRWWKRSSNGVAIVTGSVSGVIVVDVDPRNGGSVEALEELVGRLPPGPVVASGRGDGGCHFWLRHPGGLVPSGPIAPGIDLLGDGHLAIVPPSIHPEGEAYRWESGHDAPLPEAPERLLDLVVPDERSTGGHGVRPAVVGSGRRRGAACASASQRSEFTELWSTLGITLLSGDRHYRCPFHSNDDGPSCHIDAEGCRWKCFGCGAQGGLRALRERVTGSAKRASEQGTRPSSPYRTNHQPPKYVGQTRTPHPDPSPKCGVRMMVRNRLSGVRRVQRFPCDRKLCTECGPLRRARKVENYLGHMCATGGDWYSITVSDEAVAAVAKRIARAGAKFVKVPAPDQRRTVLTTMAFGTPIGADEQAYREALTRTFDVEPADGRHVSASKGWAEPRPESNGEWELDGMVKATIAKVRQVAADMGVLRAVVDEAFLPWGGEAVILDDTSPLWDIFCDRIGLFWPERRLGAVA